MASASSTGFDLLLQTLKLPQGSEVLCSAITIPDMLYVLRYHGLVAVPIDLDPETLAVDIDQLRQSVTEVEICIHDLLLPTMTHSHCFCHLIRKRD